MAAPSNNSTNGPGQTTGQQGPAQTGPKQTGTGSFDGLLKDLAAGNVEVQKLEALYKTLETLLNKNRTTIKGLKGESEAWGSELRRNIEYAEDIDVSTRKILHTQEKIKARGIRSGDLKDYTDALKKIQDLNNKQMESGLLSKKQTQQMQKNAAEIARALENVEGASEDAFDPDRVDRLTHQMSRMTGMTREWARTAKSVSFSGAVRDIHGAHQAVRHLFQTSGKNTRRLESIQKYAQIGGQIKDLNTTRKAARTSEFETRNRNIYESKAKWNVRHRDSFYSTDAEGKETFDKKGYRESQKAVRENIRLAARQEGLGRIGARIFANGAAGQEGGEKSSVFSRVAGSIMSRGGGHMGHGLASMAAGALEGGIGTITEMAGPYAIPLAIAGAIGEKIVQVFDKNQTMNSDVHEKLGGSGIYAPGSHPVEALQQVRRNLNGPMFSALGIGYDKNLEIASSLQKAGFSNQNLASATISKDGQGMLNGSFGSLQRNVYQYGRMAGLDSSTTMDQTIKLVTQYKQSLGSTEEFFVRINKASRTAGVTTMAYLHMIDEENSKYDRSNKLLEATVDTMRLLAVTGRNTADDIKESMDAATSGGSKRSMEVKAYLGMQMFRDPSAIARAQSSYDLNVSDSVGNVSRAFGGDKNFSEASIREKMKNGGMDAIDDLLTEAKKKYTSPDGTVDTTATQAASAAIEGLRKAMRDQTTFGSIAETAKRDPTTAGLNYAVMQENVGENIISQRLGTIQSIKEALKQSGHSVSDVFDEKKSAGLLGDLKFKMMTEQLGTNPQSALNLLSSTSYDTAQARIQVARQGMPETMTPGTSDYQNRKALLEETFVLVDQYLKQHGGKGLTGDKVSTIQSYAKDHGDVMTRALTHSATSLEDLTNGTLHGALRPIMDATQASESAAQASDLAAHTRTTADIYKDAFQSLFNQLQIPLDFIADGFRSMHLLPTFKNKDRDSIETTDAPARLGKSIAAYKEKLEALSKQPSTPGGDAAIAATKKALDDLTTVRDARVGGRDKYLTDALTHTSAQEVRSTPMSDADSLKMIQAAGAKFIGKTATLSDDAFSKLQDKLPQLSGNFVDNTTTDAKGKVTHIITNNYNSVDASSHPVNPQGSLTVSGEQATPKRPG